MNPRVPSERRERGWLPNRAQPEPRYVALVVRPNRAERRRRKRRGYVTTSKPEKLFVSVRVERADGRCKHRELREVTE